MRTLCGKVIKRSIKRAQFIYNYMTNNGPTLTENGPQNAIKLRMKPLKREDSTAGLRTDRKTNYIFKRKM